MKKSLSRNEYVMKKSLSPLTEVGWFLGFVSLVLWIQPHAITLPFLWYLFVVYLVVSLALEGVCAYLRGKKAERVNESQ